MRQLVGEKRWINLFNFCFKSKIVVFILAKFSFCDHNYSQLIVICDCNHACAVHPCVETVFTAIAMKHALSSGMCWWNCLYAHRSQISFSVLATLWLILPVRHVVILMFAAYFKINVVRYWISFFDAGIRLALFFYAI